MIWKWLFSKRLVRRVVAPRNCVQNAIADAMAARDARSESGRHDRNSSSQRTRIVRTEIFVFLRLYENHM